MPVRAVGRDVDARHDGTVQDPARYGTRELRAERRLTAAAVQRVHACVRPLLEGSLLAQPDAPLDVRVQRHLSVWGFGLKVLLAGWMEEEGKKMKPINIAWPCVGVSSFDVFLSASNS